MDKNQKKKFTVTVWDGMNMFLAAATAITMIVFIILFKSHIENVSRSCAVSQVFILFHCKTLAEEVFIKLYESWMLDDREHINISLRFGVQLQHSATVIILDALIFVFAPHQAKSSAYNLLKQNRGFGRTQRNNHTDIVDIKALAQH